MMVETMLESSQDFGMSNGSLPQWKRELLQRRAARSRPAPAHAHAHAPPPPAQPPPDEDEELRYGPGIVKRLKSRYLSLALRDAPRRRPSMLRRAASLEHLLDERPPPAPRPASARAPRPASVAAPPALLPAPRRDIVKRARSVDALSRLDSRDEHHPPSPSPPPPHYPAPPSPQPYLAPQFNAAPHTPPPSTPPPYAPPHAPPPHAPPPHAPPQAPPPQAPPPHAPPLPPPVPAPRPPITRSARPPRRPTPLLRETERPPPDVVRAALRKFEAAPARRTAPAARVSAVLRGLEGPSRTSTPEPREPREPPPPAPRSPTPPLEPIAHIVFDEQDGAVASVEARPVSRAALEGIARAGSSMRFAFEAPRHGSHLPPLAAANPVLVGRARRVGVIRPMPAPTLRSPEPPLDLDRKLASPPPTPRLASPAPPDPEPSPPMRLERKEPPPSALVEPIPRSPPDERLQESPRPDPPRERDPVPIEMRPKTEKPLVNGHAEPKPKMENVVSRLGGANIESAWNGTPNQKTVKEPKEKSVVESKEPKGAAPWAGGSPLGARRGRAPPPAATSIVFNFSDRKEVPDYIENDGIILRGSRRTKLKAGEGGVVALRPGAGSGSSDEEGPPSPCSFRFVNDNVLINGRSCMVARPNRDRQAKLKLQFDDSLTRTFEYPSEISLCEDGDDSVAPAPSAAPAPALAPASAPAPAPAPAQAHNAALLANTHIASASLCRYTPAKTAPADFQLGVTRHAPERPAPTQNSVSESAVQAEAVLEAEGDARPCGADARAWSARTHATDLLF